MNKMQSDCPSASFWWNGPYRDWPSPSWPLSQGCAHSCYSKKFALSLYPTACPEAPAIADFRWKEQLSFLWLCLYWSRAMRPCSGAAGYGVVFYSTANLFLSPLERSAYPVPAKQAGLKPGLAFPTSGLHIHYFCLFVFCFTLEWRKGYGFYPKL